MVSTEKGENALGNCSGGGSLLHTALLSKVDTTAHLWAVGWWEENLEVLVCVGGLTVYFSRERTIIIVTSRNECPSSL